MIEAGCHCGAVRLEIAAAPATLTDCNCSICRRMGTLWAYYTRDQVRVLPPAGATDIYMWDDRSIEFHRCKVCGNVTHWSAVDPSAQRMGVNARLMAPEVVNATPLRKFDGASM
jgi:hypothetical protein